LRAAVAREGIVAISAAVDTSRDTQGNGRASDGGLPAVIRRAEVSDAPALALVGQATFLDAYAGIIDGGDILAHCANQHGVEMYRSALAQPRTGAWLAEARTGGAPVGYVLLGPSTLIVSDPSPDDLEIKRIYLLQRFRGTGLGRALMDTALGAARDWGAARVLLGVYSRNTVALDFYAKAGFHPAGERRFLVGTTYHDDAILARSLR
jgi:diamine N-acetyltransferase